jgi:hypothetical protein
MEADEHVKEVYAHFGLAIYLAQVLEHGLAVAFLYLDLMPASIGKIRSREEWMSRMDAFMDRHFETTLGKMIRNLAVVTSVPSDLEQLLKLALEKRNWLVHDYFRERAEAFMSESGRERMLHELVEAQELFSAADERLGDVVKPMRLKLGFTDEKLAVALAEYTKMAGNAG